MMMTLLNGKTRRMGETLDACGMLTIHTKSIGTSILSLCISAVWLAPARPFVVKNKTQDDQIWILLLLFFSLLKKRGEIVNQLINSALEEEEKKRRKK